MRFLCLVCADSEIEATLSKEDWKAIDRDSMAYDKQLEAQGNYILAEALQHTGTAVTVRVRKGEASVTDGPYVETKEHVAGFILVEAKDMAEAIEIAKGIPLARIGAVEVRPIMVWQ
ncbi:dehydrogenase [Devosia geojensis]|uniref:Dehydrogenase n=1 Tax=Devosia geojensis TaxID=443610 RepID=A0A0F5FS44_9HYPH|nr:YciI family protein [Devosia geojensis]KKB11689.1 dehydrogenase [Devosia geojensis]